MLFLVTYWHLTMDGQQADAHNAQVLLDPTANVQTRTGTVKHIWRRSHAAHRRCGSSGRAPRCNRHHRRSGCCLCCMDQGPLPALQW